MSESIEESTEESSTEMNPMLERLYWAWEIEKSVYLERRYKNQNIPEFPLHLSDGELIELIPDNESLEICCRLVNKRVVTKLRERWKKAQQQASFISFWSEMNGVSGFH